jgi:capsular exopolysaccharide synthesis family protein
MFKNNQLDDKKIIYAQMKHSAFADSFREIRTKLLQTAKKANPLVMVSSVLPQGGASFIALNLACAFAFEREKRALLIDCHLRQPTLAQRLDISVNLGLSDYLNQSGLKFGDIIYTSNIPRLRLIPAGKPTSASTELLTSLRMKTLLEETCYAHVHWPIILDSPAITNGSTDARILANLCDYALLVLPYGKVNQELLQQAMAIFDYNKLLGVVLNRW